MLITAVLFYSVLVFLKSTQQLNVVRENYYMIIPVSVLMTTADVYVTDYIAVNGKSLELILFMGFFAGVASILAVIGHNRWVKRS